MDTRVAGRDRDRMPADATTAPRRTDARRVRAARTLGNAPPHLYFVISAVFHYLGPSFAVLLFARVQVLGVAWLRIASAAVIFALWRRPWRRSAPGPRRQRCSYV